MQSKVFTKCHCFAVKGKGTKSEWKKQQSGIRQGCPLSPYLFVIVMTVIFRDVHDNLNLDRGMLDGLSFTELLYADDTALITNNVNAMNRLLAKVEKCAKYHGLSFNKTKCVSINFHCQEKTKYADKTKVPTADETMYLGANINKTVNSRKEMNTRISQCVVIGKKLQMFWDNPNCPSKFKLHVYDAVIRSKLVYGLNSTELSVGAISHLNAFQLKGLRRILKMKTTFVERSNSNQKVFAAANAIKNPKREEGKDIVTFSSFLHKQANQLLAHTIRAEEGDPLKECTFNNGTVNPYTIQQRRVGRPKNNWTYSTYERLIGKNVPIIKDVWKMSPQVYITNIRPSVLNRTCKT